MKNVESPLDRSAAMLRDRPGHVLVRETQVITSQPPPQIIGIKHVGYGEYSPDHGIVEAVPCMMYEQTFFPVEVCKRVGRTYTET